MIQSSGTVLITGATAALGCATARQWAANGRRVGLPMCDPRPADERGRVAVHAQGARRDLDDVESLTVDGPSRHLPA